MKKLMSIIGVVTLLTGAALAQDTPEKEMHHEKHGKHQAMLNAIPNLTEDQKAQIKEIRENGRVQMEPQREEIKKLRMKLIELKTADDPDQDQINDLIDQQAQVKAEMMKSRTEAELKIRSILTPEQRKAADAMRKERMGKRKKNRRECKEMHEAE